MKTILLAMTAHATLCLPMLAATPAHAQPLPTRTWVSGTGNDANPCSRTLPCQTFGGALVKTAINGEINCLDNAGFGVVAITKSITIDCHDVFASILSFGAGGILINIPAGNANDPLRTVRLRNISINGAGTNGTVGTRLAAIGIIIEHAAVVHLDDMLVTDHAQHGIRDVRSFGGRLHINNVTTRNNAIAGLFVSPSSGSTRIDVDIDRLYAVGNNTGAAFNNGVKAQIKRSIFSQNGNTGVESTASAGVSEVHVDDSAISSNGTGLFTNVGGALRVSNSDISFNNNRALGAWTTYGNNRASGNTNLGSFPTPAGGPTSDAGQL
jgi:hypothetical protein